MLLTPEQAVRTALDATFGEETPEKIAVAVSGGGDSMALLDLLRQMRFAELVVVSVDHGLRADAKDELALVTAYADAHGLSHHILNWQWNGEGNLQSAARDARRSLIQEWAKGNDVRHVALGHTKDDQAETFLLRLARGSGVEGLAAMAPCRAENGITWLRPMLDVQRTDLRSYLLARNIEWADDPSNDDPQFYRVKARQMFEVLAPLGLNVNRLAQTAAHMRRHREVLDWARDLVAQDVIQQEDSGDWVLDSTALAALPEALRTSILADGLCEISGNPYRPRLKGLMKVFATKTVTALHGCFLIPTRGSLRITREWAAVQGAVSAPVEIWDGRWQLIASAGENVEGLQIRALGREGLAKICNWRDTGLPRQSLWASPAVWRDDVLVSAPLAGFANGWKAELVRR